MGHRHLTREQYERALEEDGSGAARYRRQAKTCPECSAALAQPPLAPLLAVWVPPASIRRPMDWEAALRRAVAPASQQRRGRWFHARRLLAAVAVLAWLLLLTALPVAASTGPNSVLFPVRGIEEDVRWRLTSEPDRAALDADLASAYLWQARTSAAHHDSGGYQAAMQRFFIWAERLRTDIRKATAAQRSTTREYVSADLSLVSPLTTSGPDPPGARRAQSLIGDVQTESDEGEARQRGAQHGPGTRDRRGGEDGATPGASRDDSGSGRSGSP